MKCVEKGHLYEVDNVYPNALTFGEGQLIKFFRHDVGEPVNNGTTSEEILEMLIDRMKYLESKCPCRENFIVITKLEESLMWLNKRNTLRIAQGIEALDEPTKIEMNLR